MSEQPLEFEVFTLFPAAIEAFVGAGLIGKAIERELVIVRCTDFRSFAHDRHHTVDDAPFGGGAGMVIKPEPVAAALESVIAARGPSHTILLTPSGARFDQRVAERLAKLDRVALLCGRYEGIDDRIREQFVDECLSIGDFVLNGGEVAAAAIIEAVARLREGVLGNPESVATESFANEAPANVDDPEAWQPGLVLEHPHYTRPAEFRDQRVPAVLLAGDHRAVELWRRRTACLRTWTVRPELRPRWRLPPAHPIVLAVPSNLPDPERESLRELAANFAVDLVEVGTANMRDLKQLRRSVRKRHDREPWVIGVGAVDSSDELGPRVVLDVLAYESNHAAPPLILWFSRPADASEARTPTDRIDAWLALNPERSECDRRSSRRLAIPPGLIDISQPRAAPGPVAPLACTALVAMQAEGLLPAAPGRAPSPSTLQKTSP